MACLETARILLRELQPEDAEHLYTFANNKNIKRHLDFGTIATAEGAKQYIEEGILQAQSPERTSYKFVLILKPDAKPAGSCWIDIVDRKSDNATIGYFLAEEYWGKGYATEMVTAVVEFGFREIKLHRIFANCDSENLASRRVLERVGFKQEGLFRQHFLREFGWSDTCWYGLLASEFAQSS